MEPDLTYRTTFHDRKKRVCIDRAILPCIVIVQDFGIVRSVQIDDRFRYVDREIRLLITVSWNHKDFLG